MVPEVIVKLRMVKLYVAVRFIVTGELNTTEGALIVKSVVGTPSNATSPEL